MELVVRNKSFEELFREDEFITGECVGMPRSTTSIENDIEEGNIYIYGEYAFLESIESQDFVICKMIKTADKFTDEECNYIRENKGLRPSDEVTELDAYVTGFENESAVEKIVYDSHDGSFSSEEEMKKAVDILQSFVIDNVDVQIEVSFENNILKITNIKE